MENLKRAMNIAFIIQFFSVWGITQSATVSQLDVMISDAWKTKGINSDYAKEQVEKVVRIASKNGFLKQQADGYSIIGHILCSTGELDEGYQAYSMALEIRKKMSDSIGMASIYRNIANFKFDEGKYEICLDTLQRAIQLNEQMSIRMDDSKKRDSFLYNLGLDYTMLSEVYAKTGEIEAAIIEARKAIDLFSNIGSDEGVANAQFTLANHFYDYAKENSNEEAAIKALRSYEIALKYFSKNSFSTQFSAHCFHNMAVIGIQRGAFSESFEYLNKAETLYDQLQDTQGIWNVWLRKGWCFQQQNDFIKAMPYLWKSLTLNYQDYPKDEILSFFEILSVQYDNTGKPDSALIFLQKAYKLKYSILTADGGRKVVELQREFEKAKAEKERLIAEKNKLIAYGLAGLGVALLAALYLTYRFLKKRASKNLIKGRDDGREKTLKNISEHLHTSVQLEIKEALSELKTTMEGYKEVKPAYERVKKIDETIRTLSHELSITELKYSGLGELLEEYRERLEERHPEIKVHFDNRIQNEVFNYEIRLAVYRILLDLHINTMKHAKADAISFSLEVQNNALRLKYWDNGIGFNFEEVLKYRKGIGLMGILEKVELGNGYLKFFVPESGGSGFDIQFPIKGGRK